jgi:hypothetical protein
VPLRDSHLPVAREPAVRENMARCEGGGPSSLAIWHAATAPFLFNTSSGRHHSMRLKKLCGARTRQDGHPCKRKALANGRCRIHGGLSTGPKTIEGRARIAQAQRDRWARMAVMPPA